MVLGRNAPVLARRLVGRAVSGGWLAEVGAIRVAPLHGLLIIKKDRRSHP